AAGWHGEEPVRAGRRAPGALGEAGREAGDRQAAEQVRVEHQARVVGPVRQRPQRTHQQEVVLDGRLALLRGEPLRGLEDGRTGGVAGIVAADVAAVRGDGLDLGDDVEGAPAGELDVDVHERLQPGA